ncbi:hypothetical protein IFM89_033318 [Coptis chinensis]|uniref:Thaumatin-like protein n=1 Tax=Coptis chinensis TaxID=261450 RepID=A0A835LKI3_9MAGN|nr:hypothetical protein IFM89_033318 [Coptis chinensis]
MWFRTGCSLQSLQFICETGDCGDDHEVPCDGGQPVYPVTLVNLAINGLSVRYEVSLIHGFNVPVTIQSDGACSSPIGCSHDLNKECPTKLMAKNSKGITVACRNACDALKDPSYCCTGATGACQPNKYSEVFKKFCPLAHVYPREDNPPIYECSASKNYTIVMCPAP